MTMDRDWTSRHARPSCSVGCERIRRHPAPALVWRLSATWPKSMAGRSCSAAPHLMVLPPGWSCQAHPQRAMGEVQKLVSKWLAGSEDPTLHGRARATAVGVERERLG